MSLPTLQFECLSIEYSLFSPSEQVWRVRGRDRSFVDIVASPSLNPLLSNLAFTLALEKDPNFPALEASQKIGIKIHNVQEFLDHYFNELQTSFLSRGTICKTAMLKYTLHQNLCFTFILLDNDKEQHEFTFSAASGASITMEDFATVNSREITDPSISKRDTRKMFVTVKHIVGDFPKVISKGTPLRGLGSD